MHRQSSTACAALVVGLLVSPSLAAAQAPDTSSVSPAPVDLEASVIQHDLSGPRVGMTFGPDGTARTQFGWHSEHQASSATRGPWFIVERVLLIAGVERREFIPSGTLVFGFRMPDDYEIGIGPNLTVGGQKGINSALVIAAGRSFRVGAIRVPVNLALATNNQGSRVTLVTGWAIRNTDDNCDSCHKEREERYRRHRWQ